MSILDDRGIIEVLQKATIAAVAASTLTTLPIGMAGRTKKPPADQKWLETVFIPNNRTGDFWGSEKNFHGMFRLILHWPNEDEGSYEALDHLKSICGYFTKNKLMPSLQIVEEPNLMGILEQGGETLFPVSIRYQAFRLGV